MTSSPGLKYETTDSLFIVPLLTSRPDIKNPGEPLTTLALKSKEYLEGKESVAVAAVIQRIKKSVVFIVSEKNERNSGDLFVYIRE